MRKDDDRIPILQRVRSRSKKANENKPICKLRKMVLNQELGSGLDLKIKETNYDNKL